GPQLVGQFRAQLLQHHEELLAIDEDARRERHGLGLVEMGDEVVDDVLQLPDRRPGTRAVELRLLVHEMIVALQSGGSLVELALEVGVLGVVVVVVVHRNLSSRAAATCGGTSPRYSPPSLATSRTNDEER